MIISRGNEIKEGSEARKETSRRKEKMKENERKEGSKGEIKEGRQGLNDRRI